MSDQPVDPRTTPGTTRREFMTTAAVAATGFMIVPRHVLGRGLTPPSDLVNIATVGVNGMGASNTNAVMSQNIVAFCDVDDALLASRLTKYRDSVYPPPAPPAAPAAPAGQGRQGGAATGPTPPATPKPLPPSKAQLAANASRPAENAKQNLRRFVDEQVPRLQRYRDYRQMLDKQKDIDAIIVATPDHMHAVIASAAMDHGKHVYVQKPLCWSVHEARYLAKKAASTKVVTQMGNQGHSTDGARRGQEFLMSGAIGDVREVHVWTNRPIGYWPQGIPRPAAPTTDPARLAWNNTGVMRRLAAAMKGDYSVPETLDWNLFLGAAPDVDYHPVYHPFNWRGWVDWGQGALGDMGAHLMDHPVWGLKLGLPTVIETVSTPFNGVCYPAATMTFYEFAARHGMPPVKLTWYDGGLLPRRPEEMGEELFNADGGVLYIGSKGKMLQSTYGGTPRLLPNSRHESYGLPKERLPRIPHESHEMNWVHAIKGHEPASCPFDYAAHLTEIMLLGIVSLRAKAKLYYDGAAMRVTNNEAANAFLTREYQHGHRL